MIQRYLLFFAVVLAIFGGAHVLVGSRLGSALALPALAQRWLWAGLALLGLLAIAGQFLSRGSSEAGAWWVDPLVWTGLSWMGFLLLFFAASVGGDVLSLAGRLGSLPPEPVRLARLGLFGLAFLGGAWGIRSALAEPRIHEVEVRLPGLPRAFDGYRIAQLTDTHIGPTLRRPWVERLVARVDSARADLVVHTGDFVDGSVARLAPHVEPLSRLRGRDGALFVTGNHESYSDARAWADHARHLGYRVLLNEHAVVERGGERLVVGGVTDLHEGRFLPDRAPDAAKAFAGAPDGFRLLLAHQPVQARDAQGLGIALQLSGHTHGGQIWPFHHLVRLAQPVVSGFGKVGDVLVFVSNGAGYWGPPMRLFAPPEVPILVLRPG